MLACFVRGIVPAALSGVAFAIVYRLVVGEMIAFWVPLTISTWCTIGGIYYCLKTTPTWHETGLVVLYSLLWPWYLTQDDDLSSQAKQQRFHVAAFLLSLVVAGAFVHQAPDIDDLPVDVRNFMLLVQVLGFTEMSIWSISNLGQGRAITSSCMGFLWRVGLLITGLAVIAYSAESMQEIARWVEAHTALAVMGISAFIVLRALFRMAPKYPELRNGLSLSRTIPPPIQEKRHEPTQRDMRITVSHESGHGLMYALLEEIPDDLEIRVREQDLEGVLGLTSAVEWPHFLKSRAVSEWHMLALLAGQVSEQILLGEVCLGSASDFHRWQTEAHSYLGNGFGSIYYHHPQNDLEMASNHKAIEALRASHINTLKEFFTLNQPILSSLSNELLKKRTMNKEDLLPFFAQVKTVEGMPTPKSDFLHVV